MIEQALAEGMIQHRRRLAPAHPEQAGAPEQARAGETATPPAQPDSAGGKLKQLRRLLLRSLPRPAVLRGYGWLAQI